METDTFFSKYSSSVNERASIESLYPEVSLPRPVRFWLLLFLLIPSAFCSLVLIYYLIVNRNLRNSLNNHVIIVLLIVNFHALIIGFPIQLNFLRLGHVWPEKPITCLAWQFADIGIFTTTVLKSLFPTNYQSLRYKLGGLLNRHIFPFTGRRDMNFNNKQINQIFKHFQQGLHNCDIILTSSEDILSFDLLTIDKCRKNEFNVGRSMLTIQRWLKKYIRDVLDESDEILHVKYQLTYTVGSQEQVDGGTERWKTIQKILELVKKHSANISKCFSEKVCYKPSKRNSAFPQFRLQSHGPYALLCLNNSQLFQCFNCLNEEETDPTSIYDQWVLYEDEKDVPKSIQQWIGVNLKDYQQRIDHLFSTFRYNMIVINYFRHYFVFPREAKQFLYKLVTSAWDLSSSLRSKIITGFSGTNDTQLLLPVHIRQYDLPELQKTDTIVVNNLLKNVGTLFIDGTNRDIAVKWLNQSDKNKIDYIVYFDFDSIIACDRQLHLYALVTFPARTDFKFPMGFKVAITLGNGLTKDRFVQARMRMRKLGTGHSLIFWSSYEVHEQIKTLKNTISE
ncbi:unnamed protein product [Rotaria sp. Silwood1]|nr:unnamed protein product [Rotaria sp. Silwood1]CAF3608784.1 unnamed protein product [Rotaria sp. Silwood1]CAF4603134.1 unnamed protein product [Rotaria sp. Silwood1]